MAGAATAEAVRAAEDKHTKIFDSMKKTVITILMALAAVSGYAQTAYSALMLSENDYVGTARTAAMGNAFTALGGDLGAVSINPAASATARYSQILITPSLSIFSSTASGVAPFEDGDLPYFEKTMKSTRTNFDIPSAGVSMYYETGRKSGIKSISASFTMNQTATYDQNVYAAGTNSTTSFIGQMAYEASAKDNTGNLLFPSSALGAENAFDQMPWKYVIGYKTGMIDPYNDIYVGATEKVYDDNTAFMGGTVDQAYGRNISGGKYEYTFNMGMNISDFLYLGANLTIHSADYSYSEYFKESAVDPDDFEITYHDENGNIIPSLTKYFNKMKYNLNYSYSGIGVSAKFGVIVTPVAGLRLGAAIQTPSEMTVKELWDESGEAEFNGVGGGRYSSASPYGENRWSFYTPMKANFGVAYTFGSFGLVSADYELSNYGNLRYTNSDYTETETLVDINDEMRNCYGIGHQLRVGAEIKPLPYLAVRAGYNLNTSAEKAYWDGWEYVNIDRTYRHKASFGLGFSSKNSFFADIACTRSFIPDEYFMPYNDYVFIPGTDEIDKNNYAPEILIRSSLWNVILTLGFRF